MDTDCACASEAIASKVSPYPAKKNAFTGCSRINISQPTAPPPCNFRSSVQSVAIGCLLSDDHRQPSACQGGKVTFGKFSAKIQFFCIYKLSCTYKTKSRFWVCWRLFYELWTLWVFNLLKGIKERMKKPKKNWCRLFFCLNIDAM